MANGGVRSGEWEEIDDVSVWGMNGEIGIGIGQGVRVGS